MITRLNWRQIICVCFMYEMGKLLYRIAKDLLL